MVSTPHISTVPFSTEEANWSSWHDNPGESHSNPSAAETYIILKKPNNNNDLDDDNDGVKDSEDNNTTNKDSDNDGIEDGADADADGKTDSDNDDYQIKITNDNDIEYILSSIKQSYIAKQ